MAEQVNQRIEEMINELEQMKRTSLYNEEEIREISRKRKEFEYRLQRRVKQKEDYVHYIAYELALLEDISLRRKKTKLTEKKKDLEYAIAKRLNKVFKTFIYRFQNDVEIYFQYIKFCKSVGFDYAISGIIGQMLQIHGDKPKMWQLASKYELEEHTNLDNARDFLLKGIHRHPESEILYLDLLKVELKLTFKAEEGEEKEKHLKRADVVWRSGMKNVTNVSYLFKVCDISRLYDVAEEITKNIKKEIWARRQEQEVWSFIADRELEGCHWEEIEEFIDDDMDFPTLLNNYIATYEEALQRFPLESVCTKYIHGVLKLGDNTCNELQKIRAVRRAWLSGHEAGALADHMYAFGIEMLKIENQTSSEELMEILDVASKKNPKARNIWEEKIILNKGDDKKMMSILDEATKKLSADDAVKVWNVALENIDSKDMLKYFIKKFQNCEHSVVLCIKPKLLQKMYDYNGLKAARDLYEEFIRTPPTQIDLHRVMIDIEKEQDKVNVKCIRKCYECLVQHHGKDNIDLWSNYMKFEIEMGSAHSSPAIYRRAVGMLNKDLVDQFIKAQALAKLK